MTKSTPCCFATPPPSTSLFHRLFPHNSCFLVSFSNDSSCIKSTTLVDSFFTAIPTLQRLSHLSLASLSELTPLHAKPPIHCSILHLYSTLHPRQSFHTLPFLQCPSYLLLDLSHPCHSGTLVQFLSRYAFGTVKQPSQLRNLWEK